MYCNKNQPNDYIFDYIFCEINWMFGYIKNALDNMTRAFLCCLRKIDNDFRWLHILNLQKSC